MSSLRIARAHTRLVSAVPVAPERLARWEAEFRELDGDAVVRRWVQPDEWLLIRHLRLRTRWRADEPDLDVSLAWSQALDQAIAESLARDDDNCVRYRDRRDAMADLLYRSSLRDTRRQWAWHRMGLLPRAELGPDDALHHGLSEIARQPELAWPVLLQLLAAEDATAAFTAALRALGGSLVPQLLRLSPRSAPYATRQAARHATGSAQRTRQAHAATQSAPEPQAQLPAAAFSLQQWARRRPLLAQRHRDALTPLFAAIAWPAPGLSAAGLDARLQQARAWLAVEPHESSPAPSTGAPPPLALTDVAPRADKPATEAQPLPDAMPPLPPAALPELPPITPTASDTTGQATAWGGALFWLNRAGAAWQAQAPDIELLAWLYETARALGVPAQDPALAAFCGGEVPERLASEAVAAQAQSLVAQWEAWLAGAAPDLPTPRVSSVAQRHGRLVFEPGWITLHLPITAVDTAIRRLALDLDPGWLPWLGCVVRIVYDDA